jgi:hypothetical protein
VDVGSFDKKDLDLLKQHKPYKPETHQAKSEKGRSGQGKSCSPPEQKNHNLITLIIETSFKKQTLLPYHNIVRCCPLGQDKPSQIS